MLWGNECPPFTDPKSFCIWKVIHGLLTDMAAKPFRQYHMNMDSKSLFSTLRTAFCVTTATVFQLCCENGEHCQTKQSKPTPYFTHSQATNFDEIQYFSKLHVQRKAVPFVTIIMDNTQLNVQHNHSHKKLLFNRQHAMKQVNGLRDIHMKLQFPCSLHACTRTRAHTHTQSLK